MMEFGLLLSITPDGFEQLKTVGNTSTEFTDLLGPYQTSHRCFPTSHRHYTTFSDQQGRERSASKSAKCDLGLSYSFLSVCLGGAVLLPERRATATSD